MKTILITSLAALAAAALPAATPAAAQHTVVRERTVVRGPSPHRPRTVCTTRYRNHHRVRTCRTVR